VPGVREDNEPTVLKKPPTEVMCSEGNHPIKLKQLIKINFTENMNKEGTITKNTSKPQYQCLVCAKTLSNIVKTAALQKCGHVMCVTCLDTLKKDKQCVCGKGFKEKHIIKLDNGGTAYSESSGEKLKPKVVTPAFVG